MKENMKVDGDRKQEAALGQERKRLIALEILKGIDGPSTNAEEVEEYVQKDIPEKEKQNRLKKELTFARDSSTTLPRVDLLFRVQVTLLLHLLCFPDLLNLP